VEFIGDWKRIHSFQGNLSHLERNQIVRKTLLQQFFSLGNDWQSDHYGGRLYQVGIALLQNFEALMQRRRLNS
jgi:hypothetical protein